MQTLKSVAIEEVSPGALLGVDIVDANGLRLLARGTVLTGSQLDGLRRKGVREIGIVLPRQLDPALREQERAAAAARLAHLFRGAGTGPVMQSLRGIVLAYRLERLEIAYRGAAEQDGS